MFLKNIFLIFIFAFLLLHSRFTVVAQEMTAPGYRLQMQQIEASPSAKLGNLLPYRDQEKFDSQGFVVNTIATPLLLSLSNSRLEFDELVPREIQTRKSHIRVTGPAEFGFQVQTVLLAPFANSSGDQIPLGLDFATQYASKVFSQPLMIKINPPADLKQDNYSTTIKIIAFPNL